MRKAISTTVGSTSHEIFVEIIASWKLFMKPNPSKSKVRLEAPLELPLR